MLGTASRPVGRLCSLQPCRRIHQSIVSGVDSAIPIRLSIERTHQSLEYGCSVALQLEHMFSEAG